MLFKVHLNLSVTLGTHGRRKVLIPPKKNGLYYLQLIATGNEGYKPLNIEDYDKPLKKWKEPPGFFPFGKTFKPFTSHHHRLPRPSTCGSLAVRAGPSCLVTGLLEAAVDAYPGKG